MTSGIPSTSLTAATVADELIGNREISPGVYATVRVPLSAIANIVSAQTIAVHAATLAELNTLLNYPAYTGAFCYDPVFANSGVYQKQGASGTGSWLKIGELPDEVTQALVQASEDAVNAAQAAVAATQVYEDTDAGLAAVASGAYFHVPSPVPSESTIMYRDNAGVAEEVKRYPSADGLMDTERKASFSAFNARRKLEGSTNPKALVLVLLGQSNNTGEYGPPISGTISPKAYMPNGGNHYRLWDFAATDVEWSLHHNDISSAVVNTETTNETPMSGAISMILGGPFERIYTVSVAIGAREFLLLIKNGMRNNIYAVLHRLCGFARADGFDPQVAFTTMHGENDMISVTPEEDYVDRGMIYYQMCQLAAAQAMEKPDYIAPLVFHHPNLIQTNVFPQNGRPIHEAIRRLSKAVPNAILAGPSYPYPIQGDHLHQTIPGYRLRGELDGYLLRRFFEDGKRTPALEIVRAVRTGTTVLVHFNEEITRDTSYLFATTLNSGLQLAGFEYFNAATPVQVTAVTAAGRTATLTLASNPGTTVGQTLRIAELTQSTSSSTIPNQNGSQIRVNESGWTSQYDPTFVHHRWAIPQLVNVE
jgi:hypothetical protein